MFSKIDLKPGLPQLSSGGKYVPPATGFRSGVKKTLIGHPPLPELAWKTVTFITLEIVPRISKNVNTVCSPIECKLSSD